MSLSIKNMDVHRDGGGGKYPPPSPVVRQDLILEGRWMEVRKGAVRNRYTLYTHSIEGNIKTEEKAKVVAVGWGKNLNAALTI